MKTLIIGTNLLLKSAEKLLLMGEITQPQYKEMCRRNDNIQEEHKETIVRLSWGGKDECKKKA